MKRLVVFVACATVLFCRPAAAQENDADGCKDSPVLTRLPGCIITDCESKEFDAVTVWTTAWKEENAHLKPLEGAADKVNYACGPKVSAVQVSRNVEAALKKAGFTIVFAGEGEGSNPVVTAHKGAQWIQVQTNEGGGVTDYYQTAVLVKEMKQEVEADASAMAAEIEKTGSVAVYGINFESAKATLTPDSENTLKQVLALMQAHEDWRFEVQGHTDNVGAKQANQILSGQRADAVVQWLVKRGIDKPRLTAKGYGDSQPVGDNSTPEGKAKNRRVELKKL